MANNNNEGADNSPEVDQDSVTDKSFVGKIVSGLISNTPLSKWFGSAKTSVRRRDELDDDESFSMHQPPYKRAKLPSDLERDSYISYEIPQVSTSNSVGTSRVYNSIPEPVPGPSGSGINSRRQFSSSGLLSNSVISKSMLETPVDSKDFLNGAIESDSEESTSGYCSQVQSGSKKAPPPSHQTFNTSLNPEKRLQNRSLFGSTQDTSRSLFSERSLSPQVNTSLSTRRPAFNASTFGSPNFVDKTMATKRILNSPFYNGRTMYGGASACRSRSNSGSDQSARQSVRIKPVNEENKPSETRVALSKTARRILNTLEQYSTPISDAKKIPVSDRRQGLLSRYIGATPYSRTLPKKSGATQELQVPTVPQLIQLKQKERLQNSTVSVRHIATTSKSQLNDEYKLRLEEQDKLATRSNKMKSGIGRARQKQKNLDPLPMFSLPEVSLPISTLPKFDFVLSPPSRSEKVQNTTTSISTNSINTFKFSQPLVISNEVKKIAAINDFKFSQPLDATNEPNVSSKMPESRVIKAKSNGENVTKSPLHSISQSVSEVRELDSETPRSKTTKLRTNWSQSETENVQWECSSCMVRNDPSVSICIACTSPKVASFKSTLFGFKPDADTWECTTCMIRNKNDLPKCAACESPHDVAPNKTAPIAAKTLSTFGDQFKPPPSTWECGTCMIRNKNDLNKCAACESAREGGATVSSPEKSLLDSFKAPSDTWECPTCLIRNKNGDLKCVACETSKPGVSSTELAQTRTSPPPTTFSFGIKPTSQPSSYSFGVKTTTSASTSTPSFSFGIEATSEPSTTSSFTFGVKTMAQTVTTLPATATTTISTTTSFSFGVKSTSQSFVTSTTNNFSFGRKSTSGNRDKDSKSTLTGFGDSFKKKDDEWECSSCLVRNKILVKICSCCGTPKPGSMVVSSVPVEQKPVDQFNLGIVKTNDFNFGIPTIAAITATQKAEVKIDEKTSEVTSSTTTSIPTFSFGASSQSQTGFGFGNETSGENAVANAIVTNQEVVKSPNPLLKADEKLPPMVEPIASPSTIKFGVPGGVPKTTEKQPEVRPLFSAPAVVTTAGEAAKKPTFEFKPSTVVNGEVESKKIDLFSNSVKPAAAPSFKFEPVSSTTANQSPGPMFKFGSGASTSETAPLPSFSASNSIKRSFGESLENNKDFGNVSNINGLGAKMPAFESPKTFGTPQTIANKTDNQTFMFGDSSKTTVGFGFGSPSAMPMSNTPTNLAPPFKFGGTPTAPPLIQQQQQQQPLAPSSGFNFAASPPPPSSSFSFGAANKTDAFGVAPNVNVFGSPPNATGAAKNGSFNFGAPANNNQKAIFTFGTGQTGSGNQDGGFPAAPVHPPGGGFNFGATPAAPGSTGFNFTGAQPSFNFSDGSGGQPQRRIRKALRRTHR